jgi:hypothetical protein
MRRLLVIGSLLMLLFACKREYSFEGGGALPAAPSSPTSPGTISQRHCVACPYLPFCDSSSFTYKFQTGDTAAGLVHLLADTTINGKTYAQVSGFAAFNTGLLYNCDAGIYRLLLSPAQFGLNIDSLRSQIIQNLPPLPVPIDPATIQIPSVFAATILKSNENAGATWLDTLAKFPVSITTPFPLTLQVYVGIEYTYLQKNSSYTVLGTTYTEVQYVQGKPKIGIAGGFPIPLPIPPINAQMDFYLAKNVGLVEMRVINDTLNQSAKLLRYRL